jgi:RAMP superfamily protein
MTWRAYQVVFRLRSPLHVGWGKVGNLQRTRPYVTGRVLWGALTMRLTRDAANGCGSACDSREYQRLGQEIHRSLAFTYFYPTTKSGCDQVDWPWPDESHFRRRFLSTYGGTALIYPHQSAAVGMLHEVEFISPNTLDTGEPVFLVGYVFEKDGSELTWQAAFKRLQLGGERGYGWGNTELIGSSKLESSNLFGSIAFKGSDHFPILHVQASAQEPGRLLAHTLATNLLATGEVEPLVGREWRSHNLRHRYAGQHVSFSDVCFAPGSTVSQALDFAIGDFGVWRLQEG